MLDSSNNNSKSDEKSNFDAFEHIRSLRGSGRVIINEYASISYKKGWAHVVEEFIKSIIRLPIEVHLISSDYAELDINFSLYEKTHEVRVWRAINHAQKQSRKTCMTCGGLGRRQIRNEKLIVICKDCINIAEQSGYTGTWLDKF